MKHIISIYLVVFSLTNSSIILGQSKYVIITDAEETGKDPYMHAVDELVKFRNPTKIINLNDQTLDEAFKKIKTIQPKYVAIVVHPETIENNFVGQVFEGFTKLDDDPFLDCAFGPEGIETHRSILRRLYSHCCISRVMEPIAD